MANQAMAAIRQTGVFLHFDFHDLRYCRNVDQIIIQKPTMKMLPTRRSWLSALTRLSQSANVRHEDMKCMILKLVPAIVVILVLGGCAQEPVDIKYFTRQFNVSLPSASGFTAVRDSSDAHGDYKFILTFSADHNDISNLLVRVPEVMGGNWTVLTNSKTYSVGGSAFRSQPGALYIDGEGSGRFRSVAIDTNRNQVYFLHSTW